MTTTSPNLTTSRTFLSSLLPPLSPSTSPIHPSSQSTNPLQPEQKPILLTLHCLFPNELLPALDLLDRRLVTRLVLEGTRFAGAPTSDAAPAETTAQGGQVLGDDGIEKGEMRRGMTVYHVRSAYASRSRYSSKRSELSATEGMSYEVRLRAWNCSCAAFAFAAFSGEGDEFNVNGGNIIGSLQERDGMEWSMGGSSLGDGVPVCKHLLACVLAERLVGLETLVEERVVSRQEVAGYAAGWAG